MAKNGNNTSVPLGFESQLWAAADALRNNMDAAEYKHVVLGLIFLKYISDAFEERHAALLAEVDQGADPEDPDEYRAANVFWVPAEARWSRLKGEAKQPTIGVTVDDAMTAIERDNPALKGVLPKDYARPNLDKTRLGQLIDLIGNIALGDAAGRSKDILGRVFEYFLSQFAGAEGKKGGQFYTPAHVVRLLVEMLAPYKGRVYDPCCGSGGMFVQSEKFVEAHGGRLDQISVYGQESNYTTWRLAKMNLAIRGIDANIAHGDSFHSDRHADLRADFVLANPPFNDSDWRGDQLREDKRWVYGIPPAGNANYAWVQHFLYHLAPGGTAGFVLANGSMSSNQSGEGDIRRAIIEADLVDCMVALPGQLFYSTQIPVCLWFLTRDKTGRGGSPYPPSSTAEEGNHGGLPLRDRRGETLFIDARQMGTMTDRTHRELTADDVARIAGTYHAWRGVGADPRVRPLDGDHEEGQPQGVAPTYADIPGFCKSATLDDIRGHGYVLTPGRYVGAAEVEDDGEPFEEKMARLAAECGRRWKRGGGWTRRFGRIWRGWGMGIESVIGDVPGSWEYTTLGEACKKGGGNIQTGPFGSQLHASDYVEHGIPSIMPQNIGDNRVIETGIARITVEDADRLSRYRVQQGDIIYSRRGDVERRALIREEEEGWLCGTGCLRVRLGNDFLDPLYTSFYLGHPNVREWVARHAHGATMPNLNTSILSSLPTVVPPLPEQRAIAAVLGALDDKIELNRRMNATLEAMARALFKSWFVDFDPVRAKMAGQPTGLPAELSALFPGGMEEGEDGVERPLGWEVKPLDEIATYLNGLALQKYPATGADFLPVIKIAQLRKGNTDGADRANPDIPSDYIIDDGDILFSWSGSLEVVIWCGGRGALNQHLFKVASNEFPKWYYYLWTKEHLTDFQEIAAGKATTMGHIQRKHLTQAKAFVPPSELIKAMDNHMSPIIERIVTCNVESRTLAALRDGLLPKLMNGEVRVPLAEQAVADAL